MPSTLTAARANRGSSSVRAVRYLVREAGIRQFLDIGTGIPTAANVHEVAQSAAPESRVLYVDNDPIVLAHARALMTSDPAGATAFIQADLREPGKILADPELRATLDLGEAGRPSCCSRAVLHFLDRCRRCARHRGGVRGRCAASGQLPGSPTHSTADFSPRELSGVADATRQAGVRYTPRSQAEVAAFFSGLDPSGPGRWSRS